MKTQQNFLILALILLLGCGGNSSSTPMATNVLDNITVPKTYTFPSKFDTTQSSVSYSGQVLRQVLLKELSSYIDNLTNNIDTGAFQPVTGDTLAALNFYYEFDSTTSGDNLLTISTTTPLKQLSYNEISSGKNLKEKLAGNDLVGQHEDWTLEFTGWDDKGVTGIVGSVVTPEDLLISFFTKLDELAVNRVAGNPELDPDGVAISSVAVTSNGLNLEELISKFLLGAVAYSQATDDYLDDDLSGKGINSDNITQDGGTSQFTALEHGWDEAFGYFGSARDYNDFTDTQLSASGGNYFDTNSDTKIDLQSEFNYSLAIYANKRDLASHADAKTDFSKSIFDAFLNGRAIISSAKGNLTAEEKSELKKQRDIIVNNWEKVIAANMIHYLNDVIVDMNAIGTSAYVFVDHAAHWSEMKGFSLNFQFNSKKIISHTNLDLINEKIGVQPVIATDGADKITAYKIALLEVREILKTTYSFDAKNVGDENGLNGW